MKTDTKIFFGKKNIKSKQRKDKRADVPIKLTPNHKNKETNKQTKKTKNKKTTTKANFVYKTKHSEYQTLKKAKPP